MQAKREIRERMLQKRQALTAQEIDAAAAKIAEHLAEYKNKSLAAYAPMRGEVDALKIAELLHAKIALPCIAEKNKILTFRSYHTGDPLVQGKHQLVGPPISAPEIQPEILLVPLLAFDKTHHRLGYGGGYYDATIAALKVKNPGLLTIGLAYQFQQVDSLPHEAHDVALDMIVTEMGRV